MIMQAGVVVVGANECFVLGSSFGIGNTDVWKGQERGNVLIGASVHSNYEPYVYQARSAAGIYCLGRLSYM